MKFISVCIFVFFSENDTLLLASGAQDCFIRIWKFGLKKNDDRHNNIKELRLDEKTFVVTTEKGSVNWGNWNTYTFERI